MLLYYQLIDVMRSLLCMAAESNESTDTTIYTHKWKKQLHSHSNRNPLLYSLLLDDSYLGIVVTFHSLTSFPKTRSFRVCSFSTRRGTWHWHAYSPSFEQSYEHSLGEDVPERRHQFRPPFHTNKRHQHS